MQAHRLHLPLHDHHHHHHHHHHQRRASSSPDASAPVVSCLLVEPCSRCLALMLSDSSFLLYPPLPLPLPPASFPPPAVVPPISTSACFLRLQPCRDSDLGRVLFLSAAPRGASVLLRTWILSRGGERFVPARLSFNQDRLKLGIVLDVRHGFSVALAASVNVFVLHSPAAGSVWVCAARLAGEVGDEEPSVDVMKCAVIECTSPIFSIRVSPGFLLLGEAGGVRVFPLRPLVKGRPGGRKRSRWRRHEDRNQNLNSERVGCGGNKLPNGVVADVVTRGDDTVHLPVPHPGCTRCFCNGQGSQLVGGETNVACDPCCGGKVDTERASARLRTVKLRQNSGDIGSYFVAIHSSKRIALPSLPAKAISIHALSHKRFLIVDSFGDLHLLSLCNPIVTQETTFSTLESSKDACMTCLDYTMKVQMLAVLPDSSMRPQIIWTSDALHSVHVVPLTDFVENDRDSSEKKLPQLAATQAIFTSKMIQDIAPLSANAAVILGQGDIYMYEIA